MSSALKIPNFHLDENPTFSLTSESDQTLHSQHGQLDSLPPASPASTNQFDCQSCQPGSFNDDSELPATIRNARNHQHVDLTMLRLSFRKLMSPEHPINHPLAEELPNLSCSEFSNLVSAVVRMHDDERETLGIKPPISIEDTDRNEIDQLENLTANELLDICRQEGIVPPDTCQT
jgi:hypothetical protein